MSTLSREDIVGRIAFTYRFVRGDGQKYGSVVYLTSEQVFEYDAETRAKAIASEVGLLVEYLAETVPEVPVNRFGPLRWRKVQPGATKNLTGDQIRTLFPIINQYASA